jgi:hypothetical protein
MQLKWMLLLPVVFFWKFIPIILPNHTVQSWQNIQTGLELGLFRGPSAAGEDNFLIYVLKIDPKFFEIDLYCQSEYADKQRSLFQWAEDFNLKAVINGGMFAKNLITSVGYLKSGNHINNPGFHPKYNSILACNPLNQSVPPVAIIDRTCEDFSLFSNKYQSFLQSIRMISCQGKNVWQPQEKGWSIAALGINDSGNLLMIYCSFPLPVHDFIQILLQLPLDIRTTMYLEGGFQAGLHLSGPKNPSYSSAFPYPEMITAPEKNNQFVIPNVIGVREIRQK